MKASIIALVASALLGSAAAGSFQERRHAHALLHHQKKDYPIATSAAPENETCGCTTIWSTWYGEATLMQPPAPESTSIPSSSASSAPSTTPAATYSAVETTSSVVESTSSIEETTSTPAPKPATSSAESSYVAPKPSSYVAPKPSSYAPKPETTEAASIYSAAVFHQKPSSAAAPKPKPSKPSSSGGGDYGNIGGGDKWAMTYSAYKGDSSSSSSCKSQQEVDSDIATIAGMGFSTVRIYATDCNHLQNVGEACKKHGLKMILGIFIDAGGIGGDAESQLSDITGYFSGDYSLVEMLLVGNEALFNGYTTAGELASFVQKCKQTLKDDGFSGPVSTAETVKALTDNSGELCDALDVLAANIHPFFNGNVQPGDSGEFVDSQMEMLGKLCGGNKATYNTETGWPTEGPSYMNAQPGESEQQQSIASMSKMKSAGKTVFFSYQNDGWKNNGEPSVEPYWGCGSRFEH